MKKFLFAALLIAACVPPPPLGSATKKAFDAQAKSGQRPDGASHLSTNEVLKIMGIETTNTNTATKKITGGTQSKEPINTQPQ